MMLQLKKFIFGSVTGGIFGWTADEKVFESMYKLVGYDRNLAKDYLYNPHSELSLEERRNVFTQTLKEKGASKRLQFMISTVNYKILENSSLRGNQNNLELEMLEHEFRAYYPELFDKNPGYGFINSLNLKTKCNDHDIPLLLKSKK